MLQKTKLNPKTEVLNIFIIIICARLVSCGMHVFVYKAEFAPCGIDGIAKIIQDLSARYLPFTINPGVTTYAINIPLLIAAWFILKKRYVIYTIIYTIIYSTALIVLEKVQFYQYDCTVFPNTYLIAAIFGGVSQGLTGIMFRLGASSGGIDVIGCLIQTKARHKDVEKIIAYVSYVIVAVVFFVYGNLNSVCLSVVCIFVCEKVTTAILKSNRQAIKFEIVADKETAKEIKKVILFDVFHGATILKGQGAFTEDDKEIIVCLVNYQRLPEFLKLVKKFPNVFLY